MTTPNHIPEMSSITITDFTSHDIRFPTSLDNTGTDAMNLACNYSAAYCLLKTNSPITGHGMTFTIGRGNDLVAAAIPHLASLITGYSLSSLVSNWSKTWRLLTSDSQLRWIGPEKGVIHLALGAVVNAIWDLWAKVLQKPVWKIVCDMTAEELVGCIDFRYIEDALTKEEAIAMLKETEPTKATRLSDVDNNTAVPAYTTSAGWLGYTADRMKTLLHEAIDDGYTYFKLKVGGSLSDDIHRLTLARSVLGSDPRYTLMLDANQIWSVPEAISNMRALAKFHPWFIEEPTSPDDILGHKAIREELAPSGIKVATGEMCQNRIVFKQFLASGAIDICQVDSCRVGGLNEVLAILLLAKRFNVPVVPHSGGVGLPEYTQHISIIDYVVVSGKRSLLEYVDHLHEHFVHPAQVVRGHYRTPLEAGYSVEMKAESMEKFAFPGTDGVSWWRTEEAKKILEGERR